MRRCIATSKSAQRRRLFIMRGVWWLHPEYTLHRYIFPSLIVSLLLVGGVFLAATMIQHWSLLILLSGLWLITTIGIPLLLFNEISGKVEGAMPDSSVGETTASPIVQQTKRAEPIEQPVQGVYTQYLPALHIIPPATTLPPETVVAMQSSPETPMPMAPLVRVLETIDLSSSGVEHFLDTPFEYHSLPVSSQGNEIPRSERGVERVEIPKSERGMTFG